MLNYFLIFLTGVISFFTLSSNVFGGELDDEKSIVNSDIGFLNGTMVVRVNESIGRVEYLWMEDPVDLRGHEELINRRSHDFVSANSTMLDELDRDTGRSSWIFSGINPYEYNDVRGYDFGDRNPYLSGYRYGDRFGDFNRGSYFYGRNFYRPYWSYNYGGYFYNCYNPFFSFRFGW